MTDVHGGGVPHEEVEYWADSAIRRLDHVYDTLDTVAAHNGGEADIDALNQAQEMVEKAQGDIMEIEEYHD